MGKKCKQKKGKTHSLSLLTDKKNRLKNLN